MALATATTMMGVGSSLTSIGSSKVVGVAAVALLREAVPGATATATETVAITLLEAVRSSS